MWNKTNNIDDIDIISGDIDAVANNIDDIFIAKRKPDIDVDDIYRKPDANWGSSVDAFTFNSALSSIQVLAKIFVLKLKNPDSGKIAIQIIHQCFLGNY